MSMKKNIYILATGALLLIAWQNYVDPLIQLGMVYVSNRQILDASKIGNRVSAYVNSDDGSFIINEGDDYE